MHSRSTILAAAAILALAAMPGCGGENPSLSSEMDDSYYRDAQQLEREGRWDEALADYLKVIDRRGDAAPDSNLDAGLIYLHHRQNPIFAIYHFSKYLELEPNSKKATMVLGMIDSAKREFARTLPGQPLESVAEHMGYEEQVALLQHENDELRAENAALRAGVSMPVTHSSSLDLGSIPTVHTAEEAPVQPAAAGDSPISLAPVAAAADTGAPSAVTEAPEESPSAQAPKPTPAAGIRHHVVVKGDTLFSLSLRYYGNRSKWRDIFAANRSVLPTENSPLKIGVDLRIP
jgi:tetratricopeptide (TPR) repeat protein